MHCSFIDINGEEGTIDQILAKYRELQSQQKHQPHKSENDFRQHGDQGHRVAGKVHAPTGQDHGAKEQGRRDANEIKKVLQATLSSLNIMHCVLL